MEVSDSQNSLKIKENVFFKKTIDAKKIITKQFLFIKTQ